MNNFTGVFFYFSFMVELIVKIGVKKIQKIKKKVMGGRRELQFQALMVQPLSLQFH